MTRDWIVVIPEALKHTETAADLRENGQTHECGVLRGNYFGMPRKVLDPDKVGVCRHCGRKLP